MKIHRTPMDRIHRFPHQLAVVVVLLFTLLAIYTSILRAGVVQSSDSSIPVEYGQGAQIFLSYINRNIGNNVLGGWNNLAIHCYNRDFQGLSVLSPFNTLWAQVIGRGDPPQIITEGLRVQYAFPLNTYSVGKFEFWTFAPSSSVLICPITTGAPSRVWRG